MLKETGERLIPDQQREALVYAEHLARYRLAARLAPGLRVLDAGSGEGYGTAILAAAGAASVVGVDVKEKAVRHARERYRLEFVQADVAELPFEDSSFDLVACFETVEHVEDADRALAELARVLTDAGTLVVSTPNCDEYLVDNEFHEREFSLAEFDELLSRHFADRLPLYQQNWLLSAILDERQFRIADVEQPLELELSKAVGFEPARTLYSVVICGKAAATPVHVGVLTGVYEANKMAAELGKLTELKTTLDRWIDRARKAERQREGWERRATTAEQQRERAEEQVEKMLRTIDEIETSFSWRITKPLRAVKARVRPPR
ncbi:MAG: methyltransferase domain-containing protein [Gaiellaceae bacterium]